MIKDFLETKTIIYQEHACLKTYTRINGGYCRYLCFPKNESEFISLIQYCNINNIEFDTIGDATNIFFEDDYFIELLISTRGFNYISIKDNYIECAAGARINNICKECEKSGYSGLEDLYGIPGTIGGAIVNNSGAFNTSISDILIDIEVIDSKNQYIRIQNSELNYKTRTSTLKRKELKATIIKAKIKIIKSETNNISTKINTINIKRKSRNKTGTISLGSIFQGDTINYIYKSNRLRFVIIKLLSILFCLTKNSATYNQFLFTILKGRKYAKHCDDIGRFCWNKNPSQLFFYKYIKLMKQLSNNKTKLEIEIKKCSEVNDSVGIVTILSTFNYGAILQAYATQQALRRLGYNPSFINLFKLSDEKKLNNIPSNLSIKDILKYIIFNTNPTYKRFKKRHFDFRNEFLNLSKRYLSEKDLINNTPVYKNYLVGSDQTWNINNGINSFYFLDFAPINARKISYASSFGMKNMPKENAVKLNELLNKFYAISTREDDGKNIIEEYTPFSAEVHLDPTFLLTSKEWDNISSEIKLPRSIESGYILAYGIKLNDSEYILNVLKKRYNLKIITFNQGIKSPFNNADISLKDIGPREFIYLFKNATAVFTNSFHGAAFGIHFRKPIFIEAHPTHNSRIENLLTKLQLKDRFINKDRINSIELYTNYEKTESIINIERNKSLKYLKDNLTH